MLKLMRIGQAYIWRITYCVNIKTCLEYNKWDNYVYKAKDRISKICDNKHVVQT